MKTTIMNKMLNTALSNVTIRYIIADGIETGNLIENNASIYLNIDGKICYITYVPYDIDGENIDKRTRKKIAKEFIETYKFDDIVKMYKDKLNEKEEKLKAAEENKKQLENLIKEYENLKQYGELEIKENGTLISYYIQFKRNYNYRLDIYPSINDVYKIQYNYENKEINLE